jgi:nicotinate phosphoribosyltransferase
MYQPTQNLLEGIRNCFPLEMLPWDDYFPQMAEADWLNGDSEMPAVKSHFIREAPFHGAFALLGGITSALRQIDDMRFNSHEFRVAMRDMGFNESWVDWLYDRERLRIKVYAPPEGQPFFPNEPIVSVVGPLTDVRLAEGINTRECNFPSLSLTKWYRFVRVVRPGTAIEFSRRRSQDTDRTTLCALLAGCKSTSNSEIRRFFDVAITGTMGHEWIQKYGDVRRAFEAWLSQKPNRAIGLVDTKQCMEHDFPIWLDTVYKYREEIKKANPRIWGWRNDSGDLAELTIDQYIAFFRHPLSQDSWFVERMRIVLTNQLEEYAGQSIIAQIRTQAGAAGLDAEDIIRRIIWAAGTKPGVCYDQPSIDGILKLMEIDGKTCIKLAFDAEGKPGLKTSIPGFNLSALVMNASGDVCANLIFPARHYLTNPQGRLVDVRTGEVITILVGMNPHSGKETKVADYTAYQQQKLVYDSVDGDGFTDDWDNPTIDGVRAHIQQQVDRLPWTTTRLDMPTPIPTILTPDLYDLRRRMIAQGALREDQLTS